MLRPLDHSRRDGPLYPGSSRTLRDCFDPTHLLVRIDRAFDFGALARDLNTLYSEGTGRPAIHPEVVLRALLVGAMYGVPSYRQLCERIAENLAWRWFCCLRLDDPVFDHSTLSVFLRRVGSAGVQGMLDELNRGLAEAGLLSGRTYLDSSLVPANVRTQDLSSRDPDDEPPTHVAGEEVWGARSITPGAAGEPTEIRLQRYQDAEGRLPLPHHDRDARWRTQRGTPVLGYKEHLLADRSGFILARRTTPANVSDVAGAHPLLDALPRPIHRLTADSGYRAGRFRHLLWRRGITSSIPIPPTQDQSPSEFIDHGDHFVCPTGALLLPTGMPDAGDSVRYTARTADCAPCPLRTTCLAPSRSAKLLWASRYRITYRAARRHNATRTYDREQQRRRTVVEGVFAHLDRLGGTRARVRGLDRVDAQGAVTAMAHNILKALTKRRFWHRDAPRLPRPRPLGRHLMLLPPPLLSP